MSHTLLVVFAALAALAGVLWPERSATVGPNAAVVIMFDISQSMNTADVRLNGRNVSRLALAREAAKHAIDEFPCATAVGYGIFAAHRALLLAEPVEVCRHRVEIKHGLEFVRSTMAWHGNSEVAKGLYESLEIAAALKRKTVLAFISDGHEAPPINPNLRPRFDGEPGAVLAVIAGVGGNRLAPIPKSDPSGNPLGFWGADEVMQLDRFSANKINSESKSSYVMPDAPKATNKRVLGTPGSEHLSSLRSQYLSLLAQETSANYVHLNNVVSLTTSLKSTMTLPGVTAFGIRRLFAALALSLLLIYYGVSGGWLSRNTGKALLAVFARPKNLAVKSAASKPS